MAIFETAIYGVAWLPYGGRISGVRKQAFG
jgi:hypothetical protein